MIRSCWRMASVCKTNFFVQHWFSAEEPYALPKSFCTRGEPMYVPSRVFYCAKGTWICSGYQEQEELRTFTALEPATRRLLLLVIAGTRNKVKGWIDSFQFPKQFPTTALLRMSQYGKFWLAVSVVCK
ncbi:unnamed protein product [Caretta caretta]